MSLDLIEVAFRRQFGSSLALPVHVPVDSSLMGLPNIGAFDVVGPHQLSSLWQGSLLGGLDISVSIIFKFGESSVVAAPHIDAGKSLGLGLISKFDKFIVLEIGPKPSIATKSSQEISFEPDQNVSVREAFSMEFLVEPMVQPIQHIVTSRSIEEPVKIDCEIPDFAVPEGNSFLETFPQAIFQAPAFQESSPESAPESSNFDISSRMLFDSAWLAVKSYESNFSSANAARGGLGEGWRILDRYELGLSSNVFPENDYLFSAGSSQGIVVQRGTEVALVFRGTQTWVDWVSDL